jgi:hypothetical protein
MNEARIARIAHNMFAVKERDWAVDEINAREEIDGLMGELVESLRNALYDDGHDHFFAPEDIDKAAEIAGKAKVAADDTRAAGLKRSIARMEAMLKTLAKNARAELKTLDAAKTRYSKFIEGYRKTATGLEADARAVKQMR